MWICRGGETEVVRDIGRGRGIEVELKCDSGPGRLYSAFCVTLLRAILTTLQLDQTDRGTRVIVAFHLKTGMQNAGSLLVVIVILLMKC